MILPLKIKSFHLQNNNEHSFNFFSNFHLDYIGSMWAGKAPRSHRHLSVKNASDAEYSDNSLRISTLLD